MEKNKSIRVPLLLKKTEEKYVHKHKQFKSLFVFCCVCIVLLFVIRCFAISLLSLDVHMRFKINEEFVYDNELMDYSFMGLVEVFWEAKGYISSILIFLDIGVLPLVTLLLMAVFLLEIRINFLKTYPKIGFLLNLAMFAFEFLAKFAFQDVIVQSILEVIMYTDATLIHFPIANSADSSFGLALNANARSGLYLASFVSIFVILLLRVIELITTKNSTDTFLSKNIRKFKRYVCCTNSDSCRSGVVKLFFSGLSILSLYSLYQAFINETIRFRLIGLAGSLLKEKDATKVYIPLEVPDFFISSGSYQTGEEYVLASLYFINVVVFPVLYSCLSLFWILSTLSDDSFSKWVKFLSEVILDWTLSFSMMEPLLAGIVVGYLDLPLMTEFIIQQKFPVLCNFIQKKDHDDLKCVGLSREIRVGFYWLVLAVVLKQIITSFIYFKRAKL